MSDRQLAIRDKRLAVSARGRVVIITLASLLLGGFFLWRSFIALPVSTIRLTGPDGKEKVVQVEVAATPTSQERGLMFRRGITRGMLFLFETPRPLSFWMKNTFVPLDVLFFAADGSFLNAETMVPCRADPCRSYPSRGFAKYALEEPGGFVEREGVGKGWKLIPGKEY